MKRIIFLGPPGVGKGTVAKQITAKYNIPQISTGDLFRAHMKEGTALGKKAKEYIDAGKLVPDEITIGMLLERLKNRDCKPGFILDGFPRTIPQAESLEKNLQVDSAVLFNAKDGTVVQRISGRRNCQKCGSIFHIKFIPPKKAGVCDKCGGSLFQRDDDKEEAVRKRLEVYHAQTEPLVAFYKVRKLLLEVNGEQTPEKVAEDTLRILK
jgi:adenylate kinase